MLGDPPVIIRELPADLLTPVGAYLRLRAVGRSAFLMESAAGGEQMGRFSILGCNPAREVFCPAPGQARWNDSKECTSLRSLLRAYAAREHLPLAGLPFSGGLVGMIGFDFVRELEQFPASVGTAGGLAWLGEYLSFAVFDHLKQVIKLVARTDVQSESEASAAIHELESMLTAAPPQIDARIQCSERRSFTRESDFRASVERLKRHIVAGDVFQTVLSQKFEREFEGDAFQLYRALRRVNPSPYMFYLESPSGIAIGASPELLVGVENGIAKLLPIAGTRPRGVDDREDKRLEKELLADTKERAEHMMLVDLARNDLGRAAEYGSVRVDETAAVHRFSHVMHMVSRVSGRLREGMTAADALIASFPAGTVSGAPKIRALELIFEHEPVPREYYAGACGFLGADGNAEFCIALRSAFLHGDRLTYQAGAGIVAESDPEREYRETIFKAGAIERALQLATQI